MQSLYGDAPLDNSHSAASFLVSLSLSGFLAAVSGGYWRPIGDRSSPGNVEQLSSLVLLRERAKSIGSHSTAVWLLPRLLVKSISQSSGSRHETYNCPLGESDIPGALKFIAAESRRMRHDTLLSPSSSSSSYSSSASLALPYRRPGLSSLAEERDEISEWISSEDYRAMVILREGFSARPFGRVRGIHFERATVIT